MAKYLTKNRLIRLLRDKNIETPAGTGKLLIENNYNEIIKKYGKIFIDVEKTGSQTKYKKIYMSGVSVKEIRGLLDFDRKLANILLYEILKIEEKVKSVFVHFTCEMKGEFSIYENDCYNSEINTRIIVQNINFLYSKILKNLNSDFIKDDFNKYGKIPFYVISEFITMGELYKIMTTIDPLVEIEVAKYFNLSKRQIESFINILSKFRNASAHNAVVYTFKQNNGPIASTSVHSNNNLCGGNEYSYNKNLFACLVAIKYFNKPREYKKIIKQIDDNIDKLVSKCNVLTKEMLLNYAEIPINYKKMLTS